MKKQKAILIFVVLFALMCMQACASKNFATQAGKTLSVGADIYESGYPAFLELHKKGLISDRDKAKGYDLAVKYWAAYHMAQEALEGYVTIQNEENKAKLQTALNESIKWLTNLTEYINPFITGGKK